MLNGVKKISLLFILTFGFQQLIHAQYSKPVKDTLEDYFNIRAAHKDGYDFASRVIDIPSNIVQKYDKKKARIIGNSIGYKVERKIVDEKGDTIIYQERNNDFMLSDSEKVERRKYWIGTTFEIISISIWDNKERGWKTIYKRN